jgi:hypothetical protein
MCTVLYCCHRVTTQLELTNISYHFEEQRGCVQLKSHSCSGERLSPAEALQLLGRETVCSWIPTAVRDRICVQLNSHRCSGERLRPAEALQLFGRETVCSWIPTAVRDRICMQLKFHSCAWNHSYFVEILMYIRSISRAARCTQPQASSVYFTLSHSVSSDLEFGM